MCGIFCVHKHAGDIGEFTPVARRQSQTLHHRGPDYSGFKHRKSTILCHERLAIVDLEHGAQPLVSSDQKLVLIANGEIYNHLILRDRLKQPYAFTTASDCEIIIPLYRDYRASFIDMLDGMFAFVLYDEDRDAVLAARDPVGVTTLYSGKSTSSPDTCYFASELKSLSPLCDEITSFPPGHAFDSATGKIEPYFTPSWITRKDIPFDKPNSTSIRENLEAAVRKRLMADVEYGVLLSGGLDSSLIAAIAAREVKCSGSPRRIKSFSIGLADSPDLIAAQEVADFIGTEHYGYTFTLAEGLDALPQVIYHLETFDVTTIRASTPMYLLAKKIRQNHAEVKMVLSGEGSDEMFGGYLYFADAPTPAAFHSECIERIKNLYLADNLRANKSTMAWSLEARVPFLDKALLQVVMNIDPSAKMITEARMEKFILRQAFDLMADPYLPHKILWRQKEQFSDGVGYGWIDCLRDFANSQVTKEEFEAPTPGEWTRADGTVDRPETQEAWWYRKMFDAQFPRQCAESVKRWKPKEAWGSAADPSGRAQRTHLAQL